MLKPKTVALEENFESTATKREDNILNPYGPFPH